MRPVVDISGMSPIQLCNVPPENVPNPMSRITQVVRIHDAFERWRRMGSRRLANGTEVITSVPHEDGEMWMHVVFPGMTSAHLAILEKDLGRRLPRGLRTFYGRVGGLNLFLGAVVFHGRRSRGSTLGDSALQPECLIALQHELDVLGWLPANAVAFATNSWDQSVHVAGMSANPDEIVRCDRMTGAITERHRDVWTCVAHRLYRIDRLILA